ncbi:hypothetical protein [Maricaulis sp. CAU 1757]
MLFLIWQMGLLLLIAVGLGVLLGYRIWSGPGRSDELVEAREEAAELRRENETLARRLGETGASRSADRSEPEDDPGKAVAAPADPVVPDSEDDEPMELESSDSEAALDAEPEEPALVSPANPVTPEASSQDSVAGMPKGSDDDLKKIKGLGPKAEAALKKGGVSRLADIAAWSDADIDRWDAEINGRGRIRRDDWVGQAKQLTSRD